MTNKSKSTNFNPNDHSDLTTAQLATFYKAVGGDYDGLFLETPSQEVAFIYQSLGCLHSIQPGPANDGFAAPSIPSLKPKGFITWQTIQLLLAPQEHVPFLQRTLKEFDIIDPETGSPFPKILPADCFPEQPDEEMVKWYQHASGRLQREAEEARLAIDGSIPHVKGDSSGDSEEDGRSAARYFSNPLYRDSAGRPTIVRTYSRLSTKSPREYLQDRGRAVVSTVKNLWNPNLRPPAHHTRRRSWHAEDIDEGSATLRPGVPPRQAHRPRSRENRGRSRTPDSSTDIDAIQRPERSPRRQRSHPHSSRRHLSPRDVPSPHDSARPSRSNSPNIQRHGNRDQSPRY